MVIFWWFFFFAGYGWLFFGGIFFNHDPPWDDVSRCLVGAERLEGKILCCQALWRVSGVQKSSDFTCFSGRLMWLARAY